MFRLALTEVPTCLASKCSARRLWWRDDADHFACPFHWRARHEITFCNFTDLW